MIFFHTALRAKVEEAITAEMERICFTGYQDYAVYREQVGYLRGMKAVLDLAEEIEKGLT